MNKNTGVHVMFCNNVQTCLNSSRLHLMVKLLTTMSVVNSADLYYNHSHWLTLLLRVFWDETRTGYLSMVAGDCTQLTLVSVRPSSPLFGLGRCVLSLLHNIIISSHVSFPFPTPAGWRALHSCSSAMLQWLGIVWWWDILRYKVV